MAARVKDILADPQIPGAVPLFGHEVSLPVFNHHSFAQRVATQTGVLLSTEAPLQGLVPRNVKTPAGLGLGALFAEVALRAAPELCGLSEVKTLHLSGRTLRGPCPEIDLEVQLGESTVAAVQRAGAANHLATAFENVSHGWPSP